MELEPPEASEDAPPADGPRVRERGARAEEASGAMTPMVWGRIMEWEIHGLEDALAVEDRLTSEGEPHRPIPVGVRHRGEVREVERGNYPMKT